MIPDKSRIPRALTARVLAHLKPGKAALIFGARRVGKTILISQIAGQWQGRSLMLNGEDYDAQALLEHASIANYRRILDGISLLVLDEAQAIPDVGWKIKLMVDEIPGLAVIASGSSSFDLYNKTGEPLVGRSFQFRLTPFAQTELAALETPLETRRNLETRLVYGSYPEVALMENSGQREEYLREIVNAYLFKDILALDGLKNPSKLQNLCRLIAFQTGDEVSCDELGRQLGLSKNTVEKYLDILSKVFVVFRLGAYARNLRKEVVKAGKWYFCDTGIRNALIGNFKLPALRQDTGALWENYLINERIKNSYNSGETKNFYFWRTYDQQEIDLVEESGAAVSAFEFKWGNKEPRIPPAFSKAYPQASYQVINRDNYHEFVLPRMEDPG
ncbi:MAG: ATP-binding protein [Treponema sp.]|jgi:predicted AAA+ superfamily ATPase|nr:ATP-binding protein [Treponema sp.]